MKKRVVINFATTNGWYMKGQERLRETLKVHGEGCDFLGFTSPEQIGSPSHADNPYAFKLYCFMKAREMGYDQIIYADASMYAVSSLAPLWEILDDKKYIMEKKPAISSKIVFFLNDSFQ